MQYSTIPFTLVDHDQASRVVFLGVANGIVEGRGSALSEERSQ